MQSRQGYYNPPFQEVFLVPRGLSLASAGVVQNPHGSQLTRVLAGSMSSGMNIPVILSAESGTKVLVCTLDIRVTVVPVMVSPDVRGTLVILLHAPDLGSTVVQVMCALVL